MNNAGIATVALAITIAILMWGARERGDEAQRVANAEIERIRKRAAGELP